MSILSDMERELARFRAVRAAKRSLGFPEPVPVFLVGNWGAYVADMTRRFGRDVSLGSFLGVRVEPHGPPGFMLEWRVRGGSPT